MRLIGRVIRLYPPSGQTAIDWNLGIGFVGRDGGPVQVRLRHSEKALRYRGRCRDGEFELVIPRKGTRKQAEQALEDLAPWVLRVQMQEDQRREALGSNLVFLRGEALRLEAVPELEEWQVRRDGAWLFRCADISHAKAAAARVLAQEAFLDISNAAWRRHEEMALRPCSWQLRDMSSRWGSCSRSGAMRFNWRIVMAPPEVLDYLVVHELAHLAVAGHGPKYWALVERHCPDAPRLDRWLGKKGRQIMEALPKLKADEWDPSGHWRRAVALGRS